MSAGKHYIKVASRFPQTVIEPGLTELEVQGVLAKFGFTFPPDLRAMLMAGLPVGNRWPNWRAALAEGPSGEQEYVRDRLNWPLEGMLFDIEHNTFWDPAWGPRPVELSAAMVIAPAAVKAAPVLIPIWGHRYLPAEPCIAGNVVLSVYQMDIIKFGSDLLAYLKAESHEVEEPNATDRGNHLQIRCWTRWMNQSWE